MYACPSRPLHLFIPFAFSAVDATDMNLRASTLKCCLEQRYSSSLRPHALARVLHGDLSHVVDCNILLSGRCFMKRVDLQTYNLFVCVRACFLISDSVLLQVQSVIQLPDMLICDDDDDGGGELVRRQWTMQLTNTPRHDTRCCGRTPLSPSQSPSVVYCTPFMCQSMRYELIYYRVPKS